MLMKLNNKYRQRGIGLLELMLSLAIIALLLIMATRYFASANTSQQVSNAVSMIQGIRAAVPVYQMQGGGTISIDELVKKGGLPKEFKDGKGISPWSTDISIAFGSGLYTITIKTVPGPACALLYNTLKNQVTVTPVTCVNTTTDAQDMTFAFN